MSKNHNASGCEYRLSVEFVVIRRISPGEEVMEVAGSGDMLRGVSSSRRNRGGGIMKLIALKQSWNSF